MIGTKERCSVPGVPLGPSARGEVRGGPGHLLPYHTLSALPIGKKSSSKEC